ncbi:MAG: hypothetical protein KAG53_10910, partial [Endozoicomonadaceae bacterium]|nr:hypothetical protein [Endozoicomonadaceae bacterium]
MNTHISTSSIPIDSIQLIKLEHENTQQAYYLDHLNSTPTSDGVHDVLLKDRTVTTVPHISHSPMPDTSEKNPGHLIEKVLSSDSSRNNTISSDMVLLDDTESIQVQ